MRLATDESGRRYLSLVRIARGVGPETGSGTNAGIPLPPLRGERAGVRGVCTERPPWRAATLASSGRIIVSGEASVAERHGGRSLQADAGRGEGMLGERSGVSRPMLSSSGPSRRTCLPEAPHPCPSPPASEGEGFQTVRVPFLRLALLTLLIAPSPALAAGGDLHVPVAAAGPFVLLLLGIAFLPLVAGRWWHRNRNRAIVVALVGLPTAGYLLSLGEPGQAALLHELGESFSFISLLFALYVIAGGIVLRGDLAGRPRTNLFFLAAGSVLANFIGTTGASMILIRPLLRINSHRQRTSHIPVFFIFTVSN